MFKTFILERGEAGGRIGVLPSAVFGLFLTSLTSFQPTIMRSTNPLSCKAPSDDGGSVVGCGTSCRSSAHAHVQYVRAGRSGKISAFLPLRVGAHSRCGHGWSASGSLRCDPVSCSTHREPSESMLPDPVDRPSRHLSRTDAARRRSSARQKLCASEMEESGTPRPLGQLFAHGSILASPRAAFNRGLTGRISMRKVYVSNFGVVGTPRPCAA